MKKALIFKFITTIALFFLLFFMIDINKIISSFVSIRLIFATPLLFIVLSAYIFRAIRWQILLNSVKVKLNIPSSYKYLFMGIFFGIFTPGKAGEFARAAYFSRSKTSIVATVLAEKIIDIGVLSVLSLFAILLIFKNFILLVLIICILIALAIIYILSTHDGFASLIAKKFRIESHREEFVESMKSCFKSRGLALCIFASLVFYMFMFCAGYILLNALNPALNPLLIFCTPLLILLGNIPITISGLGLREFVTVFCFSLLSANPANGFAFSILLFAFFTLLPSIIGYFFVLSHKSNSKNVASNYFEKHTSQNFLIKKIMHRFHLDLFTLIQKANPKSTYDFGSGRGFTVEKISAAFPGIKITGSDLESQSVSEAKRLHPHLSFVKDNIYNSKQKSDSFDVVTACEVLEHLDNPNKGVREAKRIAKKYCIFTVPNEPLWRFANIARLKYLSDFGNTPGHLQNFTRQDFRRLLKKHFKKVKIKNSTLLWNMAICKK